MDGLVGGIDRRARGGTIFWGLYPLTVNAGSNVTCNGLNMENEPLITIIGLIAYHITSL